MRTWSNIFLDEKKVQVTKVQDLWLICNVENVERIFEYFVYHDKLGTSHDK